MLLPLEERIEVGYIAHPDASAIGERSVFHMIAPVFRLRDYNGTKQTWNLEPADKGLSDIHIIHSEDFKFRVVAICRKKPHAVCFPTSTNDSLHSFLFLLLLLKICGQGNGLKDIICGRERRPW